MKCPYCPAQIAYLGEPHSCAYPELASNDPAGPEDFGGSDEESHLLSSAPRIKNLSSGLTKTDLKRAQETGGITWEEARALRDKIFEQYEDLRTPLKARTFFEERSENLGRSMSEFGTHVLKTWPEYFDAVLFGRKTFEIRRNDRGFHEGDLLVLREWDPESETYTGRKLTATVTYVTEAKGLGALTEGFVCMGIRKDDF